MYVFINNKAYELSNASAILGIEASELINAGHTVNHPTDTSAFNYSSIAASIGESFTEVMDDLHHDYYNNRFNELY